MKKYLVFMLLVSVFFTSCKKDRSSTSSQTGSISVTGASVAKSGSFTFYAENSSNGVVKIYKQPDGKYVLALEKMYINSVSDLELYLSSDSILVPGAIKLFSFKSIDGTLYYELPANIDISVFTHVVIQNDIMQKPLASAEIQ